MKIAVIGLGLIGGSIFKRLRKEGLDVIGISASQSGENISSDYELLSDCDVVFVASPMNLVPSVLEKISNIVKQTTIVTDVCSLKGFLLSREYPFNFIPSHPMAGTEFKGFEHSFESMFEGAKWVITPLNENQDTTVLEDLIMKMGAKPVYATAEEHDKAVALISHAPMVIAQAIFKAIEGNDLALKLASSGFRDMTRLAMSNTEMAKDMIELNSFNIQNSLLKVYASIGELLEHYDETNLTQIAEKRMLMYKDGKNVL